MQSPDQPSQRPPMKGDDASQGAQRSAPSSSPGQVPLFGIVFTFIVLVLATALALRQAPHADMLRAVGQWDFGNPSWWAYPLERNAFKRNIIRGNLRDVTAVPATQLRWAVGEGGLILHSQDGGRNWLQQHPAPVTAAAKLSFEQLFNVMGSANAMDAPDPKASKSPRYQPPSKQVVQKSVEPLPPIKALADVQQNAVLPPPVESNAIPSAPQSKQPIPKKIDRPIRPPADPLRATLNSVYFNDAQHGWAAGSEGALLVTADGGTSWRVQPSGTNKDIFTVIFASDMRRGWLVLADNHLRITEDGGLSWREQNTFDDTPILREMLRATGRATLGLRSSNDKGLIRATGDEVWVMAQNALTVARPGGNTTVGEWPGFVAASMQISSDGQRIAVAGSRGEIRFSADAGKNWQTIETGKHGEAQALQCDETLSQCVAIGDSGSVLLGENLLASPTNWRSLTPGAGATFIWARFKDGEAGDEGEAVTGTNLQLATNDGGMNWEVLGESKLPASTTRYANMFIDGKFQWRVGVLGKAERSEDGTSWRTVPTGSDNWLWSVFFLRDHQRGWISGSNGEILATRDGGSNWQVQPTPNRNWLWHVSMDGDGKHGRALGGYGTVLQTDDGGVRWRESAPYRRYPAPWFGLLLVLGGTLLTVLVPRYLRSRNQRPDEAPEGPAGSLNSDQPITQLQQDRLGYRPAIEALANFLRNSATEPRITIAISGPWGSGKSSMMRMLQTEMQQKGYRTAWFNAWHHQQEGRQLTALFNVVRRQGVPTFFRQPIAALRVRSRLIWGRSAFYRVVCIAIPLVVLVAVGDFSRQPDRWERFKLWLAHETLQWDRVVITDKSIDKLKPVEAKAVVIDQSAPKAEPAVLTSTQSRLKVRPEVLTYMKNALVWESGEKRHCGDKRNIAEEDRCVFKQPDQLLVTIEKGTGLTLWPSEREVILGAAEPIPVPPLFPALEHFIVPMLGLLGLLFTKGMTVYGLEVLRPLRNLFGTAPTSDGGKEASGAIEHYRREYCLLTEALDGRLLVFVDDIDRCNADTVNGIMELTNYLVDVGRCFVVLGMAMDRVKACIHPNDIKVDPEYADQYLRKLIHIELPVPLANAKESLGLFVQHAGAKLQGEEARLEARRRWVAQLWAIVYPWLRRVTIFVLLILAISLAVTAGRVLNNYRQPPALNIPPVEEVVKTLPAAYPARLDASLGTTSPQPLASAPLPAGEVGMERQIPTRMPWTLLGVLGGLLSIGLVIGSSRVLQERVTLALGGAMRTRDSDNFRLALETWLDAVRMHDDTPRGIKRFCNRARLFALYEKQDAAALQRDGVDIVPTPDVHIVALAAIHHVSPELLKALAIPLATAVAEVPMQKELQRFIDAHMKLFAWPDVEAIERFIERVERIAVR